MKFNRVLIIAFLILLGVILFQMPLLSSELDQIPDSVPNIIWKLAQQNLAIFFLGGAVATYYWFSVLKLPDRLNDWEDSEKVNKKVLFALAKKFNVTINFDDN